ncbi:MAG: hypothetical protein PHW82_05765 [Bacteroidales bacterium]|nr:hypothetical protein [Bacteroidales bacterium]
MRIENDIIGEVNIPQNALYGINAMKITTFIFAFLFSISLFSQDREIVGSNTNNNTSSSAISSDFKFDYFIIGGSLGLGPIVSTNLVNTGFIGESTLDLMIQLKHHRFGVGLSNTLMGTPENLAVLLFTLGKDNVNLHKGYLMYELTLFKNSPINIGIGAKFGSFTVGNYPDTTKLTMFASAAPVIEVGHPKLFFFIKPEIGYNSYNTGSWKRDLYVCINLGFRFKMEADEENARP